VNLVELDLSNNFLSSIPLAALTTLTNLKFLNLGANKIQVIKRRIFLAGRAVLRLRMFFVPTRLFKYSGKGTFTKVYSIKKFFYQKRSMNPMYSYLSTPTVICSIRNRGSGYSPKRTDPTEKVLGSDQIRIRNTAAK
jgi:hypothetical protein